MGIIWIFTLVDIAMLALICVLFVLWSKTNERYIKLEEWAEHWMKRLEQRTEACDEKIKEIQELMPRDGKNELLRHNLLLQQMNDEMEKNLQMEREWNEGIASILNYGKPITEVNKNE